MLIKLRDTQKKLMDNLRLSKERMIRNNSSTNSLEFELGQLVWLKTTNLASSRPCPKLSNKKLGPFKIIERMGPVNYKLLLPGSLNIHPVFHISLLEPFIQRNNEPVPLPLDNSLYSNEYYVKSLLDSKIVDDIFYYLVRWHNFGPEEDSWEPLSNLANALPSVRSFHKKHPALPMPSKRLLRKRRIMLRT